MSVAALFQPFARRSLRIRNRIAMASMARWATPGGDPSPLADFYRSRIVGGAGLVLTEGLAIDRPSAGNDRDTPRLFGAARQAWPAVIAAVQSAGGAIVPQLWHCGATAKPGSGWAPPRPFESPSGLQAGDVPRGRAMTERDIAETIAAYADAAAAAEALGFDGVEIHAGHGYLIDQFFWAETNRRADAWGGDTLAARSRFALEVVKAARAAVGPGVALLLRISQWKSADLHARLVATPAELGTWLAPFVDAGIDIFNVSQLRHDAPAFEGSTLSLAGWVRKTTGAATIIAGGIGMSSDFIHTFAGEASAPEPVDGLARRLEAGEFDMVAVGRGWLADRDWAVRVRDGRARSACPAARLAPGLDLVAGDAAVGP